MHVEIQKVKLSKADRLEVTYKKKNDGDGASAEVSEKHHNPAHDDLVESLKAFAVHFAILAGYMKVTEIKGNIEQFPTNDTIDSFHVSGISIGGAEEDEGIVISGHRILPSTGKAIILNTPFTRFNEDDKSRYKFMDALIKLVEHCKKECLAYLGGKFKPSPQQELVFKEDEQEETK